VQPEKTKQELISYILQNSRTVTFLPTL